MALAKVQTSFGIHTTEIPGSVALSLAPTVGNVIVALLGVNIAFSLISISSSWKLFDAAGAWRFTEVSFGSSGASCHMVAVYRYVAPGDTATLPAFFTSGTTYWTHAVWEVSGVSGNWADDLLFSFAREDAHISAALPVLPAVASGSLALTSVACYNGNVNPSISGSWTSDFVGNNASNFGNLGGASRSLNAGDAIDGAWTPNPPGGGNPYGGICLVLTPAAPTRRYPRQCLSTQSEAGAPSAHVPWTPVVGNMIVAFLFWRTDADPTIDATNWHVFDTLTHSGALFCTALGRYVQVGDTSALSAFTTAGSGHHGLEIFEVEGVTGDFSADVVSIEKAFQNTASPFSTIPDTSGAEAMALIGYGQRAATVVPDADSSWAKATQDENNSAFGAVCGWCKVFDAAGSTVQATITPNAADEEGYIQLLFGGVLSSFTPPPFLRVD